MNEIREYLLSKQDINYRNFTLSLILNVDPNTFIGVRLPIVKKYAKELDKKAREEFLNSLPHKYHEENLLHASILLNIKDYDDFINKVNEFLPHVSNWSVYNTICNKYLVKYKEPLIKEIYKRLKSDELYRVRYLMSF